MLEYYFRFDIGMDTIDSLVDESDIAVFVVISFIDKFDVLSNCFKTIGDYPDLVSSMWSVIVDDSFELIFGMDVFIGKFMGEFWVFAEEVVMMDGTFVDNNMWVDGVVINTVYFSIA